MEFRGQELHDMGAYQELPMSGKITRRVTQPWAEPIDEKERAAKKKAEQLMEEIRVRREEN